MCRMGTKRARLIPLSREVAIHEIRPVPRHAPDARTEFFEERKLPLGPQTEERPFVELQRSADLRDGICAVSAALRLLRWRRHRLERLIAAHADTTSLGKSSC